MAEAIISFVQKSYSVLGVSVKSYGNDSLILTLPSDCSDISGIIVELVEKFDLSIDFQLDAKSDNSPVLICWYTEKKYVTNQFTIKQVVQIFCGLLLLGAAILFLAL